MWFDDHPHALFFSVCASGRACNARDMQSPRGPREIRRPAGNIVSRGGVALLLNFCTALHVAVEIRECAKGIARRRNVRSQGAARSTINQHRLAIGAVPSLFATRTRVTVQRRRMIDLSHRNFASREKRWGFFRRRSTTSPRELVYSRRLRGLSTMSKCMYIREREAPHGPTPMVALINSQQITARVRIAKRTGRF